MGIACCPLHGVGRGERKGRAGKGVEQHRVSVVGAACRAVGDAGLLQEFLLECFVSEMGFSAFVSRGAEVLGDFEVLSRRKRRGAGLQAGSGAGGISLLDCGLLSLLLYSFFSVLLFSLAFSP